MKSYASMVLGGESRNVEQLGAYVAWLINNRLLQDNFESAGGREITRVRMQDLTGADFLATELHGELRPEQLTETGRALSLARALRFASDFAERSLSCSLEAFSAVTFWVRFMTASL